MNDDDLRRRLAASDLTSPGITLDEAVRRAAGRARSPRPSWALRLAVAAVAIWVAVFAAQAVVERNMDALVPPAQSLVAHESAPSLLVEQKLLLAELLGGDVRAPDMTEPSAAETPSTSRGSIDHRRSGSLPIRRWSHV